ncbi:PucR C-terminal helix-turn-helix domain-containing protein [Rhodococcus triatomae]|uniref:PucR C-terminal helix-turn-helix domain-containing protein n=1 Tax=Rhodococcus triatomae TaxID=300028 RepID=A0A1G8M5Y7_9NOCA|nr:helix-turn-helix domain-containing protein [Rhodococcus triatomae]SDI63273.1 PucR C-terminal helix-turn-helix domain-containing protein [Rhodococcus triatomae]
MSADKTIVLGGRPLADQLAQRTHAIVAETVDTVWTQVPFYRSLPEEAVRSDVTAIIRRNLEVFIASLRSLRPPSDDELVRVRESAGRRAEELVPLAEVLHAYHLGTEHWWAAITELAEPGDVADLGRAGALLQTHLQAATAAVLAGYGSDRATPGEDDSARRALFLALTSGTDATGTAERVGVDLPRLYWVAALHIDPHPDEQSAEVDAVVAERRKVRRLQRELDNVGRDNALSMVTSSGGGVLIPILEAEPGVDDWQNSPQYALLHRNLRDMERTIGAAVVAGVAVAAPPDVPGAYEQARAVLDVARHYGRASGAVRLRDVALEYQLTRPSAATPLLADLLSPLNSHPAVLETLESYLDAGCDRAAAATALHVHPNTVVYRLRKVATLTGLDVGSAPDLVRLVAALAARRVRE